MGNTQLYKILNIYSYGTLNICFHGEIRKIAILPTIAYLPTKILPTEIPSLPKIFFDHLEQHFFFFFLFVCVEVLRPSQPNGVMSSAVSLPNHTFTGQA